MKELTLTEIWIYPIKSLGGIQLTTSKVAPKGLINDRRWMLVDVDGNFMTQRVHTQMALFRVKIENEKLKIEKKDTAARFEFNMDTPVEGKSFKGKIWDDEVLVNEVSPVISQWFSQQLGLECRLVTFPENNPRPVDVKYQINNDQVSLADAFPFLIIGQSSLDDLNRRMAEPLPMNRFRPNFVFTGGEPFEEDTWKNFTIGNNRFYGAKPCARCVLTTVNQDTAQKGSEPLVTLSTFRKQDNKILFGQNLIAIDYNSVSVGDRISVE